MRPTMMEEIERPKKREAEPAVLEDTCFMVIEWMWTFPGNGFSISSPLCCAIGQGALWFQSTGHFIHIHTSRFSWCRKTEDLSSSSRAASSHATLVCCLVASGLSSVNPKQRKEIESRRWNQTTTMTTEQARNKVRDKIGSSHGVAIGWKSFISSFGTVKTVTELLTVWQSTNAIYA